MKKLKRFIDIKTLEYIELQKKECDNMFCRECGDTRPPTGFYPLMSNVGGPCAISYVSWFICNKCAAHPKSKALLQKS